MHCSGCHRSFSGLSNFDRHQTMREGRTACHDPLELGMVAVRHIGGPGGPPVYGRPAPADRPRQWGTRSPGSHA